MKFFRIIFLSLLLLSTSAYPLSISVKQVRGDGKIRLFNYHLGEFLEIEFRKEEKLIPAAIEKINQLVRSRESDQVISLDPNLLDLIDHLQDHFTADTVEIISGYRTKEFNKSLLKSGHAVSPTSLHTEGRALDIHLDEIREETLRDYLVKLQLGGVGYYGMLDFVHVDTGPVRYWEEPITERKLVGVLDPQSSAQLTSDKNDYLPKETPRFRWQLKKNLRMEEIQEIKLEHFWRGAWVVCETKIPKEIKFNLSTSQITCPSISSPFGKYRITFQLLENSKTLSSNEFYFKKE